MEKLRNTEEGLVIEFHEMKEKRDRRNFQKNDTEEFLKLDRNYKFTDTSHSTISNH